MFEAARRSGQNDSGGFSQLVAAFLGIVDRREEALEQAQNTFFRCKIERGGDPRPRMVVDRPA
jgi:hypothetical protein